jgi:hypothetical protein
MKYRIVCVGDKMYIAERKRNWFSRWEVLRESLLLGYRKDLRSKTAGLSWQAKSDQNYSFYSSCIYTANLETITEVVTTMIEKERNDFDIIYGGKL